MSDVNNPNGVVTYTLAGPMSGNQNRIYEYDKRQVDGVTVVPPSTPTSVVQLEPNPNGSSEDLILIRNGTSEDPVYVGIEILCDNGDGTTTTLFPYAILIRQKKDEGRGGEDSTFPTVTLTNNGTRLVLVDNVDGPATYDFDLLFSDQPNSTGNMGWLDPKLENLD